MESNNNRYLDKWEWVGVKYLPIGAPGGPPRIQGLGRFLPLECSTRTRTPPMTLKKKK